MSQVKIPNHYRSQDMMQELFEEINDYLVDQTKPMDTTSPISLPPATSSIESEEEEEIVNNNHDYRIDDNINKRIDDEKSLYMDEEIEDELPVDLQPAMYVESEDETSSLVDYTQYNDHHHDNQAICSCYKCKNKTLLGPPTQVSGDHNNNNNNNKSTKRLYRPKSTGSFVSVSSAKLAHIAGLVKQTLGSTPHDLTSSNKNNNVNNKYNIDLNIQHEIEYEDKFNGLLVEQQPSYLINDNETLIDTYKKDDTIDIDYNNNTFFEHINNEENMIDDVQNNFNSNHYWKANEINTDESNSYTFNTYNTIDDDINNHINDKQIENNDDNNNDLPIKEGDDNQSNTNDTGEMVLINSFNEGLISKITNLPFLTPMHRIGEQHTIHLKTKSARDVGTHNDRINAYNNAYFHCVMAKTDMVPWIKKQYNKGPPILTQQYVPTPKKSSRSLFNLFKRHSKSNDDNNTLKPINTTFASENISRLSLSISSTSPLSQSPIALSPQPSIHTISSFSSQQQTNNETQNDQLQAEFMQKNNSQLNYLSIDDDDDNNNEVLLPQQLESLRPSPSISMISTESLKENALKKKNQKPKNISTLSNFNNNNNNNKLDILSINSSQPSLKKSPSISSLNSNNNQPVSILKKSTSKHYVSTESQSSLSNNKREKYNIDDDYLSSLSPSPSTSQNHHHRLRSRSVSPIPQSALSYRSPSPTNLIPSRLSSPSNEIFDHQYHHQQRHMRRSTSPSLRYLTTSDHHLATRQKKNNNNNNGMAQPYRSNSNSSMRSNYSNSSSHNYADHHLSVPKTIQRSRSSEHLVPIRHHNPMPIMLDTRNNKEMVRRRSSSNLIPPLNNGAAIRTRKISNSSSHSNHQQYNYGDEYHHRWSLTPTSGRRSAEPRMNNINNNNRRMSVINNTNEDIYSYNYYDNIDDLDDLDGGDDYYHSSSPSSVKQSPFYQKSPHGIRNNKWSSSHQQQLQHNMKMEKPLRSRSPISRSQSKSSLNGHQVLDDLCSFFQHLPRHVLARYLQDAQGDFFLAKDLCMEDIMANGI